MNAVQRRTFLKFGLKLGMVATCVRPAVAALKTLEFDAAANVLVEAGRSGQVRAASMLVRNGGQEFTRSVGDCQSPDDMFLIASISKPMSVAAVMTLGVAKEFSLDDRVSRFIPDFRGSWREDVTMRHLFTHVSGLPDQLAENTALRKRHAPLSEFIHGAIRAPLAFQPGSKYSYSSMGILLAAEVAQRITHQPFSDFVHEAVFAPLGMQRSALGLGNFRQADLMQNQVDAAAPESGAGDPTAKQWDWNSHFWRNLGAPWGGVHASARDVATFLDAFLSPGNGLPRELTEIMIQNHNPRSLRPRGLGFALGPKATSPACSERAFGHGGSTGTLAWADPHTKTLCVVLTTLPSGAVEPHPRQLAADRVAQSVAKT